MKFFKKNPKILRHILLIRVIVGIGVLPYLLKKNYKTISQYYSEGDIFQSIPFRDVLTIFAPALCFFVIFIGSEFVIRKKEIWEEVKLIFFILLAALIIPTIFFLPLIQSISVGSSVGIAIVWPILFTYYYVSAKQNVF